MQITLKDIAKKAGFSKAAVSKALNDKSDIPLETRNRIKKIAREMGYSFNFAAKTLATRKTMTVGVVVAFPQIPTVLERIRGIQAAALDNGYATSIAFHDGASEHELKQITILAGRVDGLIITPTHSSQELVNCLEKINVPTVLMSEPLPGLEVDFVGDDDREGGRIAARHLLETGHRLIAYLGDSPDIPSDRLILTGMREVFAEKNMAFDERLVAWDNVTEQSTSKNVDGLLASGTLPSAFFCFSDMTALWALNRLCERGVGVPGEIALVGYDNIEFSRFARVPLTSIAQPNHEIGFQAMTIMLQRLRSSEFAGSAKKVIFPPKLIIRASSRENKAVVE